MRKRKWLLWTLFVAGVGLTAGIVLRSLASNVQGVMPSLQSIVPHVQGWASNLQGLVPGMKAGLSNLQSMIPDVQGWASNLKGLVPSMKDGLSHLQSTIPNMQDLASQVQPKEWIHSLKGSIHDGQPLQLHVNPLLVQAGLAAVGFGMWVLSPKRTFRKRLGVLLTAVGTALLLPKVLLVPFILLALYFTYKMTRNGQVSSHSLTVDASGLDSHTLAYLDEWEKQNR